MQRGVILNMGGYWGLVFISLTVFHGDSNGMLTTRSGLLVLPGRAEVDAAFRSNTVSLCIRTWW